MPYMSMSTSKTLSKEQKDRLKSEFGRLVSLIPGKSEGVLMVAVNDGYTMYHKGEEADCIHLDIRLFGNAEASDKERFALELFKVLEAETGVLKDNTIINFLEFTNWASRGMFR